MKVGRDLRGRDISATRRRATIARLASRYGTRGREFKAAPSDATIGADIVFLISTLNWATNVQIPDGTRLLDQNPLRGYDIPSINEPAEAGREVRPLYGSA